MSGCERASSGIVSYMCRRAIAALAVAKFLFSCVTRILHVFQRAGDPAKPSEVAVRFATGRSRSGRSPSVCAAMCADFLRPLPHPPRLRTTRPKRTSFPRPCASGCANSPRRRRARPAAQERLHSFGGHQLLLAPGLPASPRGGWEGSPPHNFHRPLGSWGPSGSLSDVLERAHEQG